MPFRTLIQGVVALGLLASAALATPVLQEGAEGDPLGQAARALDEGRRAKLMERWRSMDDATRLRMQARFEQLQALPPEQQRRALRRARRLLDEVKETEKALPPTQRAILDGLTERERRRVLRGLLGDEARSTAALMRSMLSEEEVARLESLQPSEREAVVQRLRQQARVQVCKNLGRIARELGVEPDEVLSLRSLPPKEQRDALVARIRQACRERIAREGLPDQVSAREWEHMESGSDGRFIRGFIKASRRDPSFMIPAERWEQIQRSRAMQTRALAALSEPSLSVRADRPGLSGRRLRERAASSRRGEVIEALAKVGRLDAEERLQVASLPPEGLWRVYRATLEKLRRGMEGRSAVKKALDAPSKGPAPDHRREAAGGAGPPVRR